jgi:hypothetical protein
VSAMMMWLFFLYEWGLKYGIEFMEKKLSESKMSEEDMVEYIKKQQMELQEEKINSNYSNDMYLKFGY